MILLSIIVLNAIIFQDTFTYIDPDSRIMVIQITIAFLIRLEITMNICWEKLKYKFSLIFKSGILSVKLNIIILTIDTLRADKIHH